MYWLQVKTLKKVVEEAAGIFDVDKLNPKP
jgi:hypothetical protein